MDRELLEAAQHGDEAAFVDLIKVRSNRLFAIAQRILRDIDRAEDALQDALVIAWRDLRGLRDPDRFDAWLTRLLVQRLHRPGGARAPSHLEPAGAAGRRTGRARRARLGRGPRPARSRLPAARAGPARDPRPAPLPRVRAVRDRRDPRHPARHGPISTVQCPPRHAGRPRGGRARRSRQEVARHERRSRPQSPPRRLVRRRPRPGRRSRDRRHGEPDRAPAPAPRVAPPLLEVPHDVHPAQARGDRRRAARRPRRRRRLHGRRCRPPAPTPTPDPDAHRRRRRPAPVPPPHANAGGPGTYTRASAPRQPDDVDDHRPGGVDRLPRTGPCPTDVPDDHGVFVGGPTDNESIPADSCCRGGHASRPRRWTSSSRPSRRARTGPSRRRST